MKIHFKDNDYEPAHITAPCLVRNSDSTAMEARIVSGRFYPLRIDLNESAFGRTFYVKRRSENPGYSQDPQVQRSLLVQTGNFHQGGFFDLVGSESSSPFIIAFAQYICGNVGVSTKKNSLYGSTVEDFCANVLYESFAGDAETSLPIYLSLRSAIASIESNSSSSPHSAWNFRLLRSYYEDHSQRDDAVARRVLQLEKTTYLTEVVERLIEPLAGVKPLVYSAPLSTTIE